MHLASYILISQYVALLTRTTETLFTKELQKRIVLMFLALYHMFSLGGQLMHPASYLLTSQYVTLHTRITETFFIKELLKRIVLMFLALYHKLSFWGD